MKGLENVEIVRPGYDVEYGACVWFDYFLRRLQ